MPFFEEPYQVVISLIIWLIGFIIIDYSRKFLLFNSNYAYILYIWHSLFSFIYLFFVIEKGGDAVNYYIKALNGEYELKLGTGVIDSFTYLLANELNISIFGCFMLFNLLGYIGLLFFYASLNPLIIGKSKFYRILFFITLFLPSLSFWTGAIGKDSISFLATGIALWSILNIKYRLKFFVLAIVIMALVRPHIAAIYIIAFSLSLLFDNRIKFKVKTFIFSICLGISFLSIDFIFKYIQINSLSQLSEVVEFIEKRQSYNQDGGGAIDISSMTFPEQLFTYVFRPLPFEANSVTFLLISFDNLFLFFLGLLFIKNYLFHKKEIFNNINKEFNLLFITLFIFLIWSILAVTTSNLGISVRQKWMFLPYLIFLVFLFIPNKKWRQN